MEDEELYQRTQLREPIPDIGEQDPITVPEPTMRGGRDSIQEQGELLMPRAAQDPTQPMRSGADDGDPPPLQWKTLREAPPVTPQAPLSGMGAPLMPQAGASDVTLQQRAETPVGEDGGGFDWSRAFFALGKGDLSAFDAERARRRNEPTDLALKKATLDDFSIRKQAARDAIDPGSNASLMAQKQYAEDMLGRAQQLREMGKTLLAKEFEDRAKQAPTMNAVQIANAMKSPRMSEVLRMIDSQSRNELAAAGLGLRQQQVGATIADQQTDNARQAAEFGLKREELGIRHQERADAAREKKEEADRRRNEALPAANQADEHIDATETAKFVARALELLPKVTYIGAGAKAANSVLGALPESLDLRTPEDREFATLIQRIAAPERHKLYGTALSKGEEIISQELLPSLGKNKQSAKGVLETIQANVNNRVKKQQTLYPGLKKLTQFEEPAMSEQDKQALEWANANPDDPRAAAIKKKLGVQ